MELIKATCLAEFSEEKLTEYISIIRSKGRMTRTLAQNLGRLQGEDYKYMGGFHTDSSLTPVKPGRFQAMEVTRDCDIRGFVTSNGIEFKRGRGFYELTKHETVQQYKEIIIQDRDTGEMFTGGQVREKLGLLPQCDKGGAKESLSSYDTREYRIFVQSTSFNRKLIGGTTFLYEINDFEDTGTTISDETKVTATATATATTTKKPATKKTTKSSKKAPAKDETTTPKAPSKSSKKKTKVTSTKTAPIKDETTTPKAPSKSSKKKTKATSTKTATTKDTAEASRVLNDVEKSPIMDLLFSMIAKFGKMIKAVDNRDIDKIKSGYEELSESFNNLSDEIKKY